MRALVSLAIVLATIAAAVLIGMATLGVEKRCATGLVPLPTSEDQGGPVETNCKWRIVRR
jgi:hypothetical protein